MKNNPETLVPTAKNHHTGLPDFSWYSIPKRGKIPNNNII
jgi:hypothetical protein